MQRVPGKASRRTAIPEADRRAISSAMERISNPVDLFSGVRIGDVLLADNIVVFKRTSTEMLKPHGVTHNYHHRFELVLPIVKGGQIHADGLSFRLNPGHAALIFPHQFHHYLDVEAGPIRWLFITFESVHERLLQPLRNSPRVLAPGDFEVLRGIVDDLLKSKRMVERKLDLMLKVSAFLRRMLDSPRAGGATQRKIDDGDSCGALLESINAHVRAHLNQPLRIADLARHTGYSVSYLRAVFRKQYGVSLGGYMRDSRLSVAASMLAGDGRPRIEDIAKACGFDSIFAFSRAFKKAMGISPRGYGRLVNDKAGRSSVKSDA